MGVMSSTGIRAAEMVFAAGSSSSSGPPIQTTVPQPLQSLPTQEMFIQHLSRKRVAQSLPQKPPENKRQRRTCRKCGIPYCKGSRGPDFCENKCRDCGPVGFAPERFVGALHHAPIQSVAHKPSIFCPEYLTSLRERVKRVVCWQPLSSPPKALADILISAGIG
ncbi:hypothetical protein B0H11DRAFT_1927098 [Mycena galericulata]|nr:hypothetical protein B0H11DRAFT_1927098 [Mycena galericulata]